MRIVFAGSPELAVPALRQLAGGYDVCAVLTGTDKEAGRGKRIVSTPVGEAAASLGLAVFKPRKFDVPFIEEVAALKPELLVVVAYWKIFPPRFLALFPRGGINLHPSLLPAFRGASPLPATILSGARTWGITVQRLAEEMDAGDILLQETYPLGVDATTASLMAETAVKGAGMLIKVAGELEAGREKSTPQNHAAATFCKLIKKEAGKINWQESAAMVDRKIRAYIPWPKAFTFFQAKRLVILEASLYAGVIKPGKIAPGTVFALDKKEGLLVQTGDGVLAVTKLQLQAKKAADHKAFANGHKEIIGSVLGV